MAFFFFIVINIIMFFINIYFMMFSIVSIEISNISIVGIKNISKLIKEIIKKNYLQALNYIKFNLIIRIRIFQKFTLLKITIKNKTIKKVEKFIIKKFVLKNNPENNEKLKKNEFNTKKDENENIVILKYLKNKANVKNSNSKVNNSKEKTNNAETNLNNTNNKNKNSNNKLINNKNIKESKRKDDKKININNKRKNLKSKKSKNKKFNLKVKKVFKNLVIKILIKSIKIAELKLDISLGFSRADITAIFLGILNSIFAIMCAEYQNINKKNKIVIDKNSIKYKVKPIYSQNVEMNSNLIIGVSSKFY